MADKTKRNVGLDLTLDLTRFPQLTQQLEDLKRGRLQLHSGQGTTGPAGQKASALSGPAALELRKLYQELQVKETFSYSLLFEVHLQTSSLLGC